MDNRFDRIEVKLDDVLEKVGEINVTLARNTKDIEHHIARTDQIEEQLLPLVKIKTTLDGMFKVMGMICTAGGFIFGAIKAVEVVVSWL